MRKPQPKRKPAPQRKPNVKPESEDKPPSRFAPSAFLSGSPESVQLLCQELADIAKARFADVTGSSWSRAARSIAEQLRSAGHDLRSFDESETMQEWQAEWHQPRGTFSLFLSFRAPTSAEVTWTTDTQTFVGR